MTVLHLTDMEPPRKANSGLPRRIVKTDTRSTGPQRANTQNNDDIFDLARAIFYRARTRRNFSRSTNVI